MTGFGNPAVRQGPLILNQCYKLRLWRNIKFRLPNPHYRFYWPVPSLAPPFSARDLKTALKAEYGPALKMLHKLACQPSLKQTPSTLHQYPPPRQSGCKQGEPAALPDRSSKPLPAPREPQLPNLKKYSQTKILWGIRVNCEVSWRGTKLSNC